MKRFIVTAIIVALFGLSVNVQAQFRNSGRTWGLSVGGAHGTNDGGDAWVTQYRAFVQAELFSPKLFGQIGAGYTALNSPSLYTAETGMADIRLLFSPFSMDNLSPYFYAGYGVSKNTNVTGSPYLSMVPMGAGIQTMISNAVLLDISGGYNLSLSDKLDGRDRTNTDLNSLTNGKNDGFYGFTIGVAFTLGNSYAADQELKKKELADAEALRVKNEEAAEHAKEMEVAEARRVKQQSDADAEALRAKEKADTEARSVKSLADAESQRVKEVTDAEARRIKEVSDAEARRLAEQNERAKTAIVLEKGKRVVLKGVNFETNKATLTQESEEILTRAYDALVANPNASVEISGHTDNVGSQKSNQSLSLRRAQAVRNWLVEHGIASNRMNAVGKGQNEPVSPNTTFAGRAENRRIEFYVPR